MVKSKKRVAAIVGLVVGVVTLRAFRKRRLKAPEEERTGKAREAEGTAAEHATAAVEHARTAATKAAESTRKKT
jgi:hypothetical protein